ncbi:MAG: cell division protein FtsB [Alphaproteobacteria bacterium]|jgi:cell division protein FtsB
MYPLHFLSAKHMVWLFALFIFSYFIYHTYHGERGLIAQESLTKELQTLSKTHKILNQERLSLENKITSLGAGDGQIDPDLLGEYAKKIGYIMPDEILITE